MPSPVSDYVICACTRVLITAQVLALWEYLITFTNEVDIFWTKPYTATSLLFIVTRWTMVVNAALQFVPDTETTFASIPLSLISDINFSVRNCEAFIWFINVLYFAGYTQTACKQAHLTVVSHICVLNSAVFSAIRVFAIWHQSYSSACIVLLLGIVPVATNLVSLSSVAVASHYDLLF